ncbi:MULTISPECIES: hypothetical protein [Streptomyces]|uniref:hypothetical protein n=1 Tax=Streptomyces TaxID=1883 RepID=UPI0004BD75EE|nr:MULTISPECIES: hypothetical protein [Streptomyces]NEB61151.1 hypothetical protein [Streptomyces diastaticus]KOT96983.1 hypothetical protein ADK87_20230 [Streptomyces sp. NRRL F-4711]KOX32223.1 hypothetical protein ADL07_13915 [Streptomyces sp. NRRL F-4707]KOX41936.1 hypothetical protein ADL09_30240 [Streptomyces sp. NRRL F-7442]MCL7364391.1 hypothetical protein [Streptomyces ardesiacus]
MAHTDQSDQTMRRDLRREIAGTIGLLTDEHDFHAMRRYRSFTFRDHAVYLRQVEALLRARAAEGAHTTVALFDPEEYADFCTAAGLDADARASRARFTAELAAHGPTVPYEGQSLTDLLPALVDEAVRQATWEYTSTLLATLGNCATCGEDLGRAAFTRASRLLHRVLETAPPGSRHLVCSVFGHPEETLVSALLVDEETDGTPHIDEAEALEFTGVLALGLVTHSPGGLVMRISPPSGPDRIHGWRLRGYGLEPLTAAEVFDAYCTDVESGDLISPESNVDYCAPPDLGEDPLPPGHHH